MGGWDQVRGLLTFVYITIRHCFIVGVAANAVAIVVVAVIIIIITQSYCESSSISCNGWYWFGIFVNGTNCHRVIAAIKRKQSNEYYTKSHTIFMHHEILRFDDSKSVAIFTQKSIFVARQIIIEKLIEQSRRLKSIRSGMHASLFSPPSSHPKKKNIYKQSMKQLTFYVIVQKQTTNICCCCFFFQFPPLCFSISIFGVYFLNSIS